MIVHTDGANMTFEGTAGECAEFWNAVTTKPSTTSVRVNNETPKGADAQTVVESLLQTGLLYKHPFL